VRHDLRWLRWLRIRSADIKRNRSRAFGIDEAVIGGLDLMLPYGHWSKRLEEMTIASDVTLRSSVQNPVAVFLSGQAGQAA